MPFTSRLILGAIALIALLLWLIDDRLPWLAVLVGAAIVALVLLTQ